LTERLLVFGYSTSDLLSIICVGIGQSYGSELTEVFSVILTSDFEICNGFCSISTFLITTWD